MTFKPGKIKKIIENLNQRRQEIRLRKDETLSDKESRLLKEKEKTASLTADGGRRRNRHKKGKTGKKATSAVKLRKKEKEAEIKADREIKEAMAAMEGLIMIIRSEQAKFRLSQKSTTLLQEIHSAEYLKAQEALAEACEDILKGLKQRDPDILETSFRLMKDRKREVQRTDILKRFPGTGNEKFEEIRVLCLDIIEDKGEKEILSTPLENLRKHIDELDQGNRLEYGKIEDPGLLIREMFEKFSGLLEEYRRGIEMIESYIEAGDKGNIVRGLFVMKQADEEIERMLG